MSVGPVGDNLVFGLEFADALGDSEASVEIVIADPDTVPPDGPPPGAQAPYCSPFEGPYLVRFQGGAAKVWHWDWATDERHEEETLPSVLEGRHLSLTVPGPTLRNILALADGQPRISFSVHVSGDSETGEGTDFFPAGTYRSLSCQTVDLS